MAEEVKKRGRKKKDSLQEVEETKYATALVEDVFGNKTIDKVEIPNENFDNIDEISNIIEEVMTEEIKEVIEDETKKEVDKHIATCFTTEEKLYIIKLISDGYRPFDIVKKARFTLKLSEEKIKRLSLNIRTVDQLIMALEG